MTEAGLRGKGGGKAIPPRETATKRAVSSSGSLEKEQAHPGSDEESIFGGGLGWGG